MFLGIMWYINVGHTVKGLEPGIVSGNDVFPKSAKIGSWEIEEVPLRFNST